MANFRIAVVVFSILIVSRSFAALHVYEGFDMGVIDDTTNGISGQSGATSIGFDAASTWSNDGTGVNHYLATGLTFGSGSTTLQTVGGAARLAGSTTGSTSKRPSRPLDVNLTGTLWGSWLIRPEAKASLRVWAVGVNDSATGHDNSGLQFYSFAENNFVSTNSLVSTVGHGLDAASGTTVPLNVASLLVFKISNIGGSSGIIDIKQWVLSSSQFDYFKANDEFGNQDNGLTETELDAVSLGSSANQMLQRLNVQKTTPATYPQITDQDVLQLFTYSSAQNIAVAAFDELRLAINPSGAIGGGLDEVTPLVAVPESQPLLVWSIISMFTVVYTLRCHFSASARGSG